MPTSCKYPCGRPETEQQQQHMQAMATALPKVQGLIFAKLIFMGAKKGLIAGRMQILFVKILLRDFL
jgi:hypothetical protein